MGQPSDQPTSKRVDELKIGDRIHDGRNIGPVEITHVQAYRSPHGEERVLLVTDDAMASNHEPGEKFRMATAAEFADAERQRDRVRAIADIRALADWYEQHTEVPAPLTVTARIHVKAADVVGKRAAIQALAAAMGVEVARHGEDGLSATFTIADYTPARVEVTGAVWGVPMLNGETSLAELPADFGADHDPTTCECEDCDEQTELDRAEVDEEREMQPVYADSVNGEEL